MQINYSTHAYISVGEIEAILKNYLIEKHGFIAENFNHNVVSEICGHGTLERPCNNYKGVSIYGKSVDAVPLSTVTTGEAK